MYALYGQRWPALVHRGQYEGEGKAEGKGIETGGSGVDKSVDNCQNGDKLWGMILEDMDMEAIREVPHAIWNNIRKNRNVLYVT